MDEGVYDLLSRGRAAAKAGDHHEARFYLEWVLRRVSLGSPDRLEALFWLSEIAADAAQKRDLLTDILAVDPNNSRARYNLAVLDGKIDPAKKIDPDRIQTNKLPELAELADDETERFTCLSCGGKMTYTPDGHSLTCEFCESRQRVGYSRQTSFAEPVPEQDFLIDMTRARAHLRPVSTQLAKCEGCGASFMQPPTSLTVACPYCDSVYVVHHADERELILPSALIPFEQSAREALRALQIWLSHHHIRPDHTIPLPQGVYLPVWVFTMGGQINWRGYRTSGKARESLEGGHPVIRRNVMVAACTRLRESFKKQVRQFDLERLVPYDPRYLVNWLAETYQVSMADASLDAREETYKLSQAEVKTLYCDGLDDLSFSSANLAVESFKLIMVPLWIMHFREEGKKVEVSINGQNGKVEGHAPSTGMLGWFERFLNGND